MVVSESCSCLGYRNYVVEIVGALEHVKDDRSDIFYCLTAAARIVFELVKRGGVIVQVLYSCVCDSCLDIFSEIDTVLEIFTVCDNIPVLL